MIKVLLRVVLKVILFPLVAALTVIEWLGEFFLGIGTVMMNLIAGLCFLTAAGCLLFQLYTLEELKMTLFGGVIFVILPHIGMWLLVQVVRLKVILMSI
jgi:hypothetical protein